MAAETLDHVNIRSGDLQSTMAFFRDVLEMTAEPRPGMNGGEGGAWVLDQNGAAVVHIGRAENVYSSDQCVATLPPAGSGPLHHIALNCRDYDRVKARIQGAGLKVAEHELPDFGLRQLFVVGPDAILFELNFRG